MTKSTLAAASAAILVFSVPSVLLWNQNRQLSHELSALREKSTEEANQLQSSLAAARADADELARLRAQQAELLRLRGETALLRRQTVSATKPAVPASPAPERAPEETASHPEKIEASFQARIQSGQTLLIGGWQTQPGKRAMALVSPNSVDPAGNAAHPGDKTQVLIQAKIIEVPDALWSSLNMEATIPGGGASDILTQDKAKELTDQWMATAGVSLLSAPRVQTVDGSPAQIRSGNDKGENVSLSFNPRLVPGENAFDLSVELEMTTSPSSLSGSNSAPPKAVPPVPDKEQ
jgi:hypothetical protein